MSGATVVVFVSKEGEEFEVPLQAARLSKLVDDVMDEGADESKTTFPLVEVTTAILVKVIEYMKHYIETPQNEIERPLKSNSLQGVVQPWYEQFVSGCEQDTLFELILAANFMNVQPLLDLTCAAVAAMSKGKTQEELKVLFRVANDLTVFTPEQEAEIREQNAWAEQP